MFFRKKILKLIFVAVPLLGVLSNTLLRAAPDASGRIADVTRYRFSGNHREDSMWSALYAAKSGKIYIGLCTHAEAAHFYEFDPETGAMKHIEDLTVFQGERGKGIRTTGKIHVRMGEDDDGNIYFGGLCEDTGPECLDPGSYPGPHWYRYNPSIDKLEDLGLINRYWGLLGMIMDNVYMCLYGLAEDGHLYRYDIKKGLTRDLGRVDDWDICRTVFSDDQGNVFGSFPVGRIWKYEQATDQVHDLQHIRLTYDSRVTPRTMTKPMIDRKTIWRVIEWDPVDKVAYGVMGDGSTFFRYDTHDGPVGTITPLTRLCAPRYLNGNPEQIPMSTLALTISSDHLIYYAPVASLSFDYTGMSWDVHDEENFAAKLAGGFYPPVSMLVSYDPHTGEREDFGMMKTQDNELVFGLGGACTGKKNGHIYFVGAVEEKNPDLEVGKVSRRWPYSMGLIEYIPESAK